VLASPWSPRRANRDQRESSNPFKLVEADD
jgi:hypothetical protein